MSNLEFGYEATAAADVAAVALDGTTFYFQVSRPATTLEPPAPPNPSPSMSETFRGTMRSLAAGVVLVTTTVDGRPWGVTVSSFTSLSVEPPRVLVSLMRNTASCQAIEELGVFGVDLLGDAHKAIAESGAARGAPKFLDPRTLAPGGTALAPMVKGALAHIDCELEQIFDGGDHAIILGRVVDVVTTHRHSSASPLVYFDGGFHHIGQPL